MSFNVQLTREYYLLVGILNIKVFHWLYLCQHSFNVYLFYLYNYNYYHQYYLILSFCLMIYSLIYYFSSSLNSLTLLYTFIIRLTYFKTYIFQDFMMTIVFIGKTINDVLMFFQTQNQTLVHDQQFFLQILHFILIELT